MLIERFDSIFFCDLYYVFRCVQHSTILWTKLRWSVGERKERWWNLRLILSIFIEHFDKITSRYWKRRYNSVTKTIRKEGEENYFIKMKFTHHNPTNWVVRVCIHINHVSRLTILMSRENHLHVHDNSCLWHLHIMSTTNVVVSFFFEGDAKEEEEKKRLQTLLQLKHH